VPVTRIDVGEDIGRASTLSAITGIEGANSLYSWRMICSSSSHLSERLAISSSERDA